MSWETIDTADLAKGKPFTEGLAKKFRDRDDAILALVDGGNLLSMGVPNPSFEIDTNSDGIPDCWAFTAYTGGSGALVTTSPMHGAKRFRCTHPGGGGNGGGYLASSFLPWHEGDVGFLSFCMNASVAGVRVLVDVKCYDKDQVLIDTRNVYDSTANPTAAALFIRSFLPYANTRFIKIVLTGGEPSVDPGAAYVWWDFVTLGRMAEIVSSWTIVEGTDTAPDWTDKGTATINLPNLDGALVLLMFPAQVKSSDSAKTGYVRFRVGDDYSTEIAAAGIPYSQQTCVLVTSATGTSVTVTMQVKIPAGGATVYGIKDWARSAVIILP